MAKIALITDQHLGARDDDQNFDAYFERFYREVFFPYLIKHNIKHVIGLGDLFDRRKYINYVTIARAREYYFKWYDDNDVKKWCIIGNHDTFYKSTNRINSPSLLLRDFKNMNIVPEACEVEIAGLNLLLVPWINPENKEKTLKLIKNAKASILLGHLELEGFQMHKGFMRSHGDDPNMFADFELVCSGHYHHKSTVENINYLGAPYEMNWLDYNDRRGFHVLDTETHELEYIENPLKMFTHIHYNDSNSETIEILLPDSIKPTYSQKYVKVIVADKTNPMLFDSFISELEKVGVLDFQIVDDHLNMQQHSDADIAVEVNDTISIIKNIIAVKPINHKEKVESLLLDLYQKAHETV